MRRGRSERPLSPATLAQPRPVDAGPADAELVASARAGDPAAFEALYARHVDAVRAVCRRRLRHSEDVADAVQDTFLRAGSQLGDLRDPERVGPWLKRIAANICTDLHRGPRITPHGPGQLVMEAVEDGARSVVEQPDAATIAADEATRLHRHLATLGDRDRLALWLRDGLDVPVPDVARELGVTEGSARVLLTRARKRLRASFAGIGALAAGVRVRLEDALRFVADHPVTVGAPAAIAATLALLPAVTPDSAPSEAQAVPPRGAVSVTVSSDDPGLTGDGGPGGAVDDAAASAASSSGSAARTPSDPAPPPVRVGDEPPAGPESVEVDASDEEGRLAGVVIWSGDLLEELPGGDDGEDGDGEDGGDEDGGDGADGGGSLPSPTTTLPTSGSPTRTAP